ncbi:MAG: oxygenase MpaB family protein [Candidatus Velamenicoccus archaeovorus]
MRDDHGFFGPDSVSWRVHREVTVLFGGARAVLMQAAHPLVIAGARETGMYERNPWRRLQRTLVLTYTITFGTRAEALAAADRINEIHRRIKGVDPVTGLPYDALDPELLLWVHACLVDSALLFEELTVGELDDAGRQRFHEEQMLAAEMVLVPREIIPPTVPALRGYLQDVIDGGILRSTDSARTVAALFHDPPKEAEWRPILRGVSRLAFGTLPAEIRRIYGVPMSSAKHAVMRAAFAAIRAARPLLPPRYRYIAPYEEWRARGDGRAARSQVSQARRRFGIRLDRARTLPSREPLEG